MEATNLKLMEQYEYKKQRLLAKDILEKQDGFFIEHKGEIFVLERCAIDAMIEFSDTYLSQLKRLQDNIILYQNENDRLKNQLRYEKLETERLLELLNK